MTDEDLKLNFITPALTSKWKDLITMETQVKFTDGRVNIQGNVAIREPAKKADYILYLNKANPIAIVEAKDNNKSVSFGLQQAISYAKMLNVPFAYSSNGDAFMEHDFLTGLERQIALEDFPTYEELKGRYTRGVNGGKGLSPAEEKIIETPFYSDQHTYSPRYYQRNAINKTLSAIARGQDRILLVMATGTGKTYTAFQIVWRLLQSGMKKKILYLADRNVLVDQSIDQDFRPLKKVIHKVDASKDDPKTVVSSEIYFSLYHQLVGEEGEENFRKLFRPDFFDLVIVDECHRGSAKDDSTWRCILEYFSSATQIGMTATPKETKYVSTLSYFGEPVYMYSLKEGVDDGFLAPFKVVRLRLNIGDEWRPRKGQCDIDGNPIEDRIYNNSDYDYKIVIQDRINEVAQNITNYLKHTDRMSKTIVFCADEPSAERMRIALNNCNQDIVQKNPDYVVRITGSDTYGKSKLEYFISVNEKYPVIATTSQLLSTGVDCKMTKLIVLDKNIGSMTEFKQIIGRGTRLREKDGKMSFTVMDFRDVTRLFADPDWDGPIEIDPNYPPKGGEQPPQPPVDPNPPNPPRPTIPVVGVGEVAVDVLQKLVAIYDANGKLLKQESIVDYTKQNILGEYSTLESFISDWTKKDKKELIKSLLEEKGISLEALKMEEGMRLADDFDFICHLAYDQRPFTRKERAEAKPVTDFLEKYKGAAREVLDKIVELYKDQGIYEVEDINSLKNDPFRQMGKPQRLVQLFGGKQQYLETIKDLEEKLYKIG